jgi:hypothetical protein
MGIKELASALTEDAAKLETSILSEAVIKAEQILRRAEEQAENLEEKRKRIALQNESQQESADRQETKMRERKLLALAESMYVARIKEHARKLFTDFMETDAYSVFISVQYEKIKNEIPEIAGVRADDKTAQIIAKIAGKEIKIAGGSPKLGFTALAKNETAEIHCTFETMYEKAWRTMARKFAPRIAKGASDGI